jgi:hypothetical protein
MAMNLDSQPIPPPIQQRLPDMPVIRVSRLATRRMARRRRPVNVPLGISLLVLKVGGGAIAGLIAGLLLSGLITGESPKQIMRRLGAPATLVQLSPDWALVARP